jgi:hypothetical protein
MSRNRHPVAAVAFAILLATSMVAGVVMLGTQPLGDSDSQGTAAAQTASSSVFVAAGDVYKLDGSDLSQQDSYSPTGRPEDLMHDGGDYVYVVTSNTSELIKLDASDLSVVDSTPLAANGTHIAIGGGNVYVALENNDVLRVDPSDLSTPDSTTMSNAVRDLDYSPNGNVYVAMEFEVTEHDSASLSQTDSVSYTEYEEHVYALASTSNRVFVALQDSSASSYRVYAYENGISNQSDIRTTGDSAPLSAYAYDGGLYTGHDTGELYRHDINDLSSLNSIDQGVGYHRSITALGSDVITGFENEVRTYDADTLSSGDSTSLPDTVLAVSTAEDAAPPDLSGDITGTVEDQHGDPVANATVYAAGYEAASPPTIDGTPFDELARDPLPGEWQQQVNDVPGFTDAAVFDATEARNTLDETRVLLHTRESWGLDTVPLTRDQVKTVPTGVPARAITTPGEEQLFACWDFDQPGAAGYSAEFGDGLDNSIVGAETTPCSNITIERVDPLGGSMSSETVEPSGLIGSRAAANCGWSGETGRCIKHHYGYRTDLEKGVYRVYPEGDQSRAMVYIVAPNNDTSSLESEIENYASSRAESISEYNEKVKAEYDAGNLEFVSTSTNDTGHYSLDVPDPATEAELRVVKDGGVNDAPPGKLSRSDLTNEFRTAVKRNFRDSTVVGFEAADEETFVSVCQRMEPITQDVGVPYYGETRTDIPNQNADIQGQYLIPPELDERVRRCAAISYAASVLDGYGDFLSPGLTDNLNAIPDAKLRRLLRTVHSAIKSNDILCETYANEVDADSCEDALTDPDTLTRGELENRVEDGYDTVDDSSDHLGGGGGSGGFLGGGSGVDVGNGDTSVDDGSNTVGTEWPVDGVSNWDDASLLVRLTWSNGSTTVLNRSSDYVSVEDSLTGSDTVRLKDYPVGDRDPAAVTARLDIITKSSTGSGNSGAVKNPTWSGDLPRLAAIRVSKWQPGAEDTVTVSVDPEDDSRFGAFKRLEVTAPNGSTTTYTDVSNSEITAKMHGVGRHRLAAVFTAADGNATEFTEVLLVDAQRTSRDRPPSIRGRAGAIGRYAVVGHGLETGEVAVERGGSRVILTGVLPQDADVPGTFTADTRDLSVASDATTTVQLRSGDTRATVRERIGIVLYADEIDDGALVWRNGDAITRAGTEWGQVSVENSTTVDVVSDETASAKIRVDADPSPIDRFRHWLDASLPAMPFGALVLDLTPLLAVLAVRRRHDPPPPPEPPQPGMNRQPNPQEV